MIRKSSVLKSKRVAVALALLLSGCSSSSSSLLSPLSGMFSPSQASSNSSTPNVQSCLLVNTATGDITKSEYVCNGKTYTAHDLYNLREKGANSN